MIYYYAAMKRQNFCFLNKNSSENKDVSKGSVVYRRRQFVTRVGTRIWISRGCTQNLNCGIGKIVIRRFSVENQNRSSAAVFLLYDFIFRFWIKPMILYNGFTLMFIIVWQYIFGYTRSKQSPSICVDQTFASSRYFREIFDQKR